MEEDEWWDSEEGGETVTETEGTASEDDEEESSGSRNGGGFNVRAEEAADVLRNAVVEACKTGAWSVAQLEREKDREGSCWVYRQQLQDAVNKVAEGLVERDEEARLVVLGMVAQEHVLLLGPPGTGKSALGLRLSQLCGGAFFQRLLTRFTTPEVLRALSSH